MHTVTLTHTHTYTRARTHTCNIVITAAFIDYNLPDGDVTVNSNNQFNPLCVPIPIINDNIPESEECFTIFFFDADNDPQFDVIEPDQAMVCIVDDDSGATRKHEMSGVLSSIKVHA